MDVIFRPELIAILCIGFGIFQIIVLVRVLKSTYTIDAINDLIKGKLSMPKITQQAQIAYMKGDFDQAKDLLDTALFKSILETSKMDTGIEHINRIDKINKIYSPYYLKMGFEMPDIERYKDFKNLPL